MEKTKQIEKSLFDLIRIIQFTEDVSTKIHGLLDESKIYNTVINEFAKSKKYTVSLLLLSKDGLKLRLIKSSVPHEKLKVAEKVAKKRKLIGVVLSLVMIALQIHQLRHKFLTEILQLLPSLTLM